MKTQINALAPTCPSTGTPLRHALFVLAGVLLSGCVVDPTGPSSCEAQRGYLEICATLFNEPAEGQAWVRADSEDELPLEALFDEQGCTTVELSPGPHEWSASALSGSCTSPYEQVTIGACEEVTQVSIELDSWCLLGG